MSIEPLRFGAFTFDDVHGELRRGVEPIPLRPQAIAVLRTLLRRRPQLVELGELRRAVWGEAAVEWEVGLHQILRQLRRALGDDPQRPVYIETLPRRGYRFRAEVEPVGPAAEAPPPRRWRALGWWLGGLLTTPALVLILCWSLAHV